MTQTNNEKLPIIIKKEADDPQGVLRISIGGNDVFGLYLVSRGDDAKVLELLRLAYVEFIKHVNNKNGK